MELRRPEYACAVYKALLRDREKLSVPRPAHQCAAGTSESRKLASKHSRKALKASLTLGILLGMFFVAWLPFFMANMVQVPRPAHQCAAGTSESRKLASKHSRKALKASLTLGILLGMFFVAWLPFFMANMVQAVCDCISGRLFDVLTWLGYCNSTMNPIIYPLFMRDFKRAMARYLPCCPRAWERRPSLVSLSVRNSHSAHRVGLSLKNMVTLPGEIESLTSDPCDPTAHPPGNKDSPATGADSVNLFDMEHAGNELLPNQINSALD
ncbi:5-hydroxytryptamine receptor 6 [Acipenser ruthenus]|uniref:5-hydroxytryptamine receptor 6 n=1 Tax=Acipenser ruthenus TaxID=7906 RepID=A0A444UVA7_ACIRT|nr:5-hydroxytryptamine receptor 6 [Acipenser ruthenus]